MSDAGHGRFANSRAAVSAIIAQKSAQRFHEALETVESALQQWPDYPTLIGQKAHVLHLMKRTDEGILLLHEAARRLRLPDFVQSIEAELLAAVDRTDEALAQIDRVLALPSPSDAAVRRCIDVLYRLGQQERVEGLLARFTHEASDRRAALMLACRLARDPSEFMRELQARYPDDPAVLALAARHALADLDPAEKAEELGVLLETSRGAGNVQLRVDRALALRKSGDSAAARKELETVLREQPDNLFALQHLAHCCRDVGDTQRALDVLEEIGRRAPQDGVSRTVLFATYRAIGGVDRATSFVEEIAALHPASRGSWYGALKRLMRATRK